MSQADDDSLLAMAAARMSPASIALTMGWSEKRVVGRLAKLTAPDPAPCTDVPQTPFVRVIVGPIGGRMSDCVPVPVLVPPPVRPSAPWIAFARRFRAARWSLAEIAWLFDRDLDELVEALR